MSGQKDNRGQHIMLHNATFLTKNDKDAEEHQGHKTGFIAELHLYP